MTFPVGILLKFISISLSANAIYENIKSHPKNITISTPQVVTRTIDNYDVIKGKDGVPIEYWYNETSSSQQYQSSPGCPQSIEGYPWVYYGSPPKCYLVGFGGPCEAGQKITLQEDSLFGICACQCFVEKEEFQLLLPNVTGRYIECTDQSRISKIFDKESNKCYSKIGQGPCPKGEVIANVTSNQLTCLPKCKYNDKNSADLEKKGLCITLPTKPFHGSASLVPGTCPDDKVYSFHLQKCILPFHYKKNKVG